MGLYIKDILLQEDPNEIIEFAVKGNGAVFVVGEHYWPDAVEVPEPHGRLIDADAFTRRINEEADKCATTGCKADRYLIPGYRATAKFANDLPTVIPASEEVSA